MAQKKTYIYRVLIGYNGNTEVDIFMYARNEKTALDYCKQLYKDKKYNYYKPIKVGISLWLRDTGIVTAKEDEQLRNSVASIGETYYEREIEMPKFITKEEAGELL